MNARYVGAVVLVGISCVLLLVAAGLDSSPAAAQTVGRPLSAPPAKASPLLFIENVGQFDSRARFLVRTSHGDVWLADDAVWITLYGNDRSSRSDQSRPGNLPTDLSRSHGTNIRISFGESKPHVEPYNRLDTRISYVRGADDNRWYAAVPVWRGVRYRNRSPGVDLELDGENGTLILRVLKRAETKFRALQLNVEGGTGIAQQGDVLSISTARQ